MLWVLCGHHLGNRLPNIMSGFQQSCNRCKLIMWPLLVRPLRLLDIVVIFLLQEREKRKCLGIQSSCRVSLRFQVPLPVPKNALWSMIPVLLLPWHLSVPKEKHRKVGAIEKLRQSFKEECHNSYCLFGR